MRIKNSVPLSSRFRFEKLKYILFFLISVLSVNASYGAAHWTRYTSGCVITTAPEVTKDDPSCVPEPKKLREIEERSRQRSFSDMPKFEDFIGTWSHYADACRSFRQKTEGPYFTIGSGKYILEGGGKCRNVKYYIEGNMLSITAMCLMEESGYNSISTFYTLQADTLYDKNREKYIRCRN
mgnify:CR=1 FL=1